MGSAEPFTAASGHVSRAFHASLDGLDESWAQSFMWLTGKPGAWNRHATAPQIDAVVHIPVSELDATRIRCHSLSRSNERSP